MRISDRWPLTLGWDMQLFRSRFPPLQPAELNLLLV